jgi:hypothetical protein
MSQPSNSFGTLYGLLLQACGLSHREAAALHGVRLDTINSWSSGRRETPAGVIADLRALYRSIAGAAANHAETLREAPDDCAIELGYPAHDHEALALGFPSIGAWRAMAAIVVAQTDRPMILVPRGSTPATAAAVDAHGR